MRNPSPLHRMKPVCCLGSSCQHKEIVVLIVLQIKRTFCAVNPPKERWIVIYLAHAGKWPGDGAAEHRLAGESLIRWQYCLRDGYSEPARSWWWLEWRLWNSMQSMGGGFFFLNHWISAHGTQILRSSKLMTFDFLVQWSNTTIFNLECVPVEGHM